MFHPASFLAYIFVTAFTPGPNTILSMSNAGRLGFRRSFPFNLGIWAGFSVLMLLCGVFCGALYTFLPRIRPFMLVLGAAYMLWLAWRTLCSSSRLEERKGGAGFLDGMLLQFVNVKVIIYGVTSLSAYVLPYFRQPLVVAGFALLLAFVGFLGTVCWALFGRLFHRLFSEHARVVNLVMALLLVCCAVSLFL